MTTGQSAGRKLWSRGSVLTGWLITLTVIGSMASGACSSASKKKDPVNPKPLVKQNGDPTPLRPTVQPAPDGSIKTAIQLLDTGDLSGAKAQLKGVLLSKPDSADAHYYLAIIAEREDDSSAMESHLRSALDKKADHVPSLEHLTNAYIRKNRLTDARLIVEKAITANSKNVDAKAVLLKVMVAEKDYTAVISKAKEFLKEDVDNIRVMIYLAIAYYKLRKYDLSLYILQYAKNKIRKTAELDYYLAMVYLARNDKVKAQVLLESAVKRNPNFPEALNNLAVIYHNASAHADAIAQLKRAIRLQPRFISAYLNLGNAYRKSGDVANSLAAFKKAIRLDPDLAESYYNLAILYLESKVSGLDDVSRYEASIRNFNKFKTLKGARVSKSDPIDKYINEAKKRLEIARKQAKRKTIKKVAPPPKPKKPEPKPLKPKSDEPTPLPNS